MEMYESIIKNAGQTEVAILEGEFVFAVSGSEDRVDSTVIGKKSTRVLSRVILDELVKQCICLSIKGDEDFVLSSLAYMIRYLTDKFDEISKKSGFTYDECSKL